MASSTNPASKRLFLALWPDDEVRQRLYQLQQPLMRDKRMAKARPVAFENLHLTLHFLGPVAEQTIAQLIHSLGHVKIDSFKLQIDRWGFFSKPKLLWLGASQPPDKLDLLLARSQKAITECMRGYSQKKFVNHITLFRKANPRMELEMLQPIDWQVRDFVLVESDTRQEGVEYKVLQRWALQQPECLV